MHIGMHAAQDDIGDSLGGVAALRPVTVDLLDPFEVDHRHDTDLEVGMGGNVDLIIRHAAMQALVEQQVGVLLEGRPIGEMARLDAVFLGFLGVMHIVTAAALAGFAIFAEDALQIFQCIRLVGEMRESGIARGIAALQFRLHVGAVEAVEGVALDRDGFHALAAEDLVEGGLDGRGARPRGTDDRDDGVFFRHGISSGKDRGC